MVTFVFFVRDADETIAWIAEKDVVLSTDDFGRDLGSVQQLQRKHDGVERDLAALEEKVKLCEKKRWIEQVFARVQKESRKIFQVQFVTVN